MTPKAFATILSRVLGLWFVVDAVFRLSDILFWRWSMRGVEQAAGWTSYPSLADVTSASETYLHDTYYVISNWSASLVSPGIKLLLGLVLLFAAHRVARLLCAGVEPTQSP